MKFTGIIAAMSALAAGAVMTGAAYAAPASRATLQGSAPSWANSQNFVAAADPGTDVGFRVYLSWRNSAAAEALARAVSDPTNASYGKYLTPAQFRAQFAPAGPDVAQVQKWLRSQGFRVQYTPQNGHYISAGGRIPCDIQSPRLRIDRQNRGRPQRRRMNIDLMAARSQICNGALAHLRVNQQASKRRRPLARHSATISFLGRPSVRRTRTFPSPARSLLS